VLASFGTAPVTAFGITGHGGPRWSFISLSGGLRLEFSRNEGTDTVQVSTSRVLGEAVPCLHWKHVVFGCGVVQAGELIVSVNGQMPDYARKPYAPSVSAGGRGGFQIPLPRLLPPGLDLYISADLTGAVRRSKIWVIHHHRSQFEWKAPPFTAAIGLGVVYARRAD
jgi:hypothetical protein